MAEGLFQYSIAVRKLFMKQTQSWLLDSIQYNWYFLVNRMNFTLKNDHAWKINKFIRTRGLENVIN